MSHQLSSCPFCGTLEVTLDGKSEHCRVRCMRCGTEGSYVYFDGKDDDDIDRAERDAVRRWNERASAAPPPADDAVSVPQGMSVTVDADGSVWLHIEAPSGRKASICLDALAVQRGGIVGAALLEWTDALAARGA
jgi:hypothetical protein